MKSEQDGEEPWLVLVLAAGCLLLGGPQAPRAQAEGKTVLRYATLASGSSAFGKVLKAWSRSLTKETEGRVELRYYPGGSQGDERSDQVKGHFVFEPPDRLYLTFNKLGETYGVLGSNAERYWWVELRDVESVWDILDQFSWRLL